MRRPLLALLLCLALPSLPAFAASRQAPVRAAEKASRYGNLKSLAFFGGARTATDDAINTGVDRLGVHLAKNGIRLVTGGGGVGEMGRVTKAMVDNGGEVVGVSTPRIVGKEQLSANLAKVYVAKSEGQRTDKQIELSQAGIVVPGGFGTLREANHWLDTLGIGYHDKPIGFFNVGGFFEPLRAQIDNAVKAGLISPERAAKVIFDDDYERLVQRLDAAVGDKK